MKNLNNLPLYLLGTVRISLSGDYCERLLNILAANNVLFRDLKKKNNQMDISILKKDFRKLRILKRKTDVKVKILSKNGLPFKLRKYKLRYGMVVGCAIFFVVLNFLSTRLWLIKVNGNELINEDKIISAVNNLGVHEGIGMKNIDVDILKLKLVKSEKNIAWSSFNKQGCVLEVNLTEFDNNDESDLPSNLVSDFDAVIKRIDVQSGITKVKVGDTVSKGQLLVSGTVDFGAGSNFVCSKGKIYAQAKKEEKIVIKKDYCFSFSTGNYKNRRILNIMGLNIPLYMGKIHGEYDTETYTHKVRMFSGEIPISIRNIRYNEKNVTTETLTIQRAAELAKEQIYKNYKDSDREIISISNENIIQDDECYIFTGTVFFTADIAVSERINFIEE